MARGMKTGGRKAGTPNKVSVDRQAAVAAAERRATEGMTEAEIALLTPLDVILLAMRTSVKDGKLTVAAMMAKEAAPYLHPKLTSETLKIQTDDSKRSDADIERELADIERSEALAAETGTMASAVSNGLGGVVH